MEPVCDPPGPVDNQRKWKHEHTHTQRSRLGRIPRCAGRHPQQRQPETAEGQIPGFLLVQPDSHSQAGRVYRRPGGPASYTGRAGASVEARLLGPGSRDAAWTRQRQLWTGRAARRRTGRRDDQARPGPGDRRGLRPGRSGLQHAPPERGVARPGLRPRNRSNPAGAQSMSPSRRPSTPSVRTRARRSAHSACPASATTRSWRSSSSTWGIPRRSPCTGTE